MMRTHVQLNSLRAYVGVLHDGLHKISISVSVYPHVAYAESPPIRRTFVRATIVAVSLPPSKIQLFHETLNTSIMFGNVHTKDQ